MIGLLVSLFFRYTSLVGARVVAATHPGDDILPALASLATLRSFPPLHSFFSLWTFFLALVFHRQFR